MKLLRGAYEIDSTLKIEKIMYAGQAMSQNDQQWLRETLDAKIVTSIIGTTEANHIAYQCPYLEGDYHHLAEDYNYFEIIDEDNNPVYKNNIGRLVVSALHKHNYPILRYLIGDSARFVDKNCPCGSHDRIIEYKGRWDDIICISQMNIKYTDIRKSLESLPISEVQIIGKFNKGNEEVIVRVETTTTDFIQLRNQIYNLLFSKVPEFHEAQKKKLFNLIIEILPVGSIARNPRTGKIKTLIDERKSNA
jgi:phenylacetate-CoA ligase